MDVGLERARRSLVSPLALSLALSLPVGAAAQVPRDTVWRDTMPRDTVRRESVIAPVGTVLHIRPGTFAGSRQEEFLRTLQLLGAVPLHPWSVRGFGPRELERMRVGNGDVVPRSMRHAFCTGSCDTGSSVYARALPAEAQAWFNTTRPFGMNDGVAWAGRGLTVAASGGVHAGAGPLSVVISPVLTWAQNQGFPLAPNGETGDMQFGDAFYPRMIDHPQRFGDGAVARLDPGESTIRLDAYGVAAGVSSASQWWGPMTRFPFVLGNNAGGFLHAFAGSANPVNVGIGHVHARLVYGALEQSSVSDIPSDSSRRLASGLVAVFLPRGLPGFEIGGGRFFATTWPAGGVSGADLRKPFEGLLKSRAVGVNPDGSLREDTYNQIISVFGRLALPRSGVELYGEYGREDHNADLRDFWLEPDHSATFGLGLRRAWVSRPQVVSVVTTEFMSSRISHLDRSRQQAPPYLHSEIRQGHTHRGQPLAIAFGGRAGEAATLSFERHGARGMTAFRFSRHSENGYTEDFPRLVRMTGSVERSVVRGPVEVSGRLTLTHAIGRADANRTNGNLELRTRWTPRDGP